MLYAVTLNHPSEPSARYSGLDYIEAMKLAKDRVHRYEGTWAEVRVVSEPAIDKNLVARVVPWSMAWTFKDNVHTVVIGDKA